jgi:hypothetical protein
MYSVEAPLSQLNRNTRVQEVGPEFSVQSLSRGQCMSDGTGQARESRLEKSQPSLKTPAPRGRRGRCQSGIHSFHPGARRSSDRSRVGDVKIPEHPDVPDCFLRENGAPASFPSLAESKTETPWPPSRGYVLLAAKEPRPGGLVNGQKPRIQMPLAVSPHVSGCLLCSLPPFCQSLSL